MEKMAITQKTEWVEDVCFQYGKTERSVEKWRRRETLAHEKNCARSAREQRVSENLSLHPSIALSSSLMLKTATKPLKTAAVGTH